MKIQGYFFCYNEEQILPFLLKHYSEICDKIIIIDQNSTDSSVEIIKSYTNTEVVNWNEHEVNDIKLRAMKNNCWKDSRGHYDYVIVGDSDEFLYCKDFRKRLEKLHFQGITIVKPVGYDMVSETMPEVGSKLTDVVRRGVPSGLYSKCMLFDPNKIVEINYEMGAHLCWPTGNVNFYYSTGDIKLLHYKWLTLKRVIDRTAITLTRINKTLLGQGFGIQALDSVEKNTDTFNKLLQEAKEILP